MIRFQIFLTVLAVTSAFPDRPRPLHSRDDDQGSRYQNRPGQPLPGSGVGSRPQQPPQIFRAAPAPLPANPPGQSRYGGSPPEPTPYGPPSAQVPVSPVYTATFNDDQGSQPQPPNYPQTGPAPGSSQPQPPNYPQTGPAPGSFQPQPPNYPQTGPTPGSSQPQPPNYPQTGPAPGSFRSQPPTYQVRPSRPSPPSYSGVDPCPGDYVRNANGNCVQPEIFRDLFVYQEPAKEKGPTEQVQLPKPKVKLNLLVIKTNEDEEDDGPIIVEQEEKTIVLVLSEKGQDGPKKVIEVPAQNDQSPEVFFIDYVPGDNSLLPGGIYLQDALKYATEVDGGDSAGYPQISSGPQGGVSFLSSQNSGGNRNPYDR